MNGSNATDATIIATVSLFFISPKSEPQSEIPARCCTAATSPFTIYLAGRSPDCGFGLSDQFELPFSAQNYSLSLLNFVNFLSAAGNSIPLSSPAALTPLFSKRTPPNGHNSPANSAFNSAPQQRPLRGTVNFRSGSTSGARPESTSPLFGKSPGWGSCLRLRDDDAGATRRIALEPTAICLIARSPAATLPDRDV